MNQPTEQGADTGEHGGPVFNGADPVRFAFGDLCDRVRVSPRTMRYALDLGLVEEDTFRPNDRPRAGRGVRRKFTVYSGFVVSLGALLLEVGLRSHLAARAIKSLMEWASTNSTFPDRRNLAPTLLLIWSYGLTVQVGDGKMFRVIVDPDKLPFKKLGVPQTCGWKDIAAGKPADPAYIPIVLVELNLSQLLTRLVSGSAILLERLAAISRPNPPATDAT